MRLQAPCGVYVEIRIPARGARADLSVAQKSCAGYQVAVDSGGPLRSLRHRLVDFRPPNGSIICTQVIFDHEVMGELSYPRGRLRDEYIEALPGGLVGGGGRALQRAEGEGRKLAS